MHKLSCRNGSGWSEHSFSPVFVQLVTGSGKPFVLAGVPGGDAIVFERLAFLLEPPYVLLYVLHSPRGEAEPGRYESPALSREELGSFLARFGGYFSGDGRFDIWVFAPREEATIAWDHHNRLFAYGPIERFASELRALGFQSGKPVVPDPHEHHFRKEFDAQASELLAAFEWEWFELQPQDGQ